MGYRSIISLMPKSSVDADAQAFLTAAAITDPTISGAINTLVVQMKADNIWSKMKAVYPMVGGTANSHKFNLKDPRDLDAAFRLTFATGVTHSANGMVSNGSSGYADTFLRPATHLLNNSCHISFYSRTNQLDSGAAYPWDCGVADDASSYLAMNIRNPGSLFRPFAQDTSVNTFSNSNSTGFYVANRTASNVKNGWKNGSKVVTSTAVSSNRTNNKVFLLALNFSNAANFYSTRQCAFASIGDGLTDAEAANLYTAVQSFQTTLGRSVGTQTVSDSDAQAFVTNAAIVDQVEATAVNNLVVGMKADGIWSKMKAIYPFVGGSASAHKFNLKDPRDLDAAFRLQFNGGWTHSSNGALPNGTNGWANTYYNPSINGLLNSAHLSFYSRTQSTGGIDMGVWDGSSAHWLNFNHDSGKFNLNSHFNITITGLANTLGMLIAQRTSSTSISRFANLTKTTVANNSSTRPNINIALSARMDGSPTLYSSRQCAFSTIGEGLTDTEAANLYTRVQAFQTALSRQV